LYKKEKKTFIGNIALLMGFKGKRRIYLFMKNLSSKKKKGKEIHNYI
jgi:hypothetical protein